MHAHISYLWEGTGPCLLMLSVSKDAFFELAKVRLKFEENMLSYKKYPRLKKALLHPDAFSLKQVIKFIKFKIFKLFRFHVLNYFILCIKMS